MGSIRVTNSGPTIRLNRDRTLSVQAVGPVLRVTSPSEVLRISRSRTLRLDATSEVIRISKQGRVRIATSVIQQAGVTDHGALTGLTDDDHLLYLNRSGVRPMTGELAMGDNKITGVVNPVAVQDAATRDYHDRGYLAVNRRSYIESEFDDPGNFAEGVQAILAGAGARNGTAAGVSKTNHPGIWCLETGTTAAGRGFIIGSATRGYNLGGAGRTRVGSIVKTGVFLSTALEEYVDRAGFFSMALPNTINEGVGFEYQFDQNGGRWQGVAEDGLGETSIDLGVTVVAETWYNLEFEVNAAGTSVEFFIDGVSRGTLATNIPSGTGFNLFYNFHIMKLAGTGNRSFYIDHYYVYQEVTR